MFSGADPEPGDLGALVDTATKWRATAVSEPSAGHAPAARRVRVRERLERGERLRADDEQRLGGIEIARRLGEVRRIDVRDEAHVERARRRPAQRVRRPCAGRGRSRRFRC
jgi:hypothetical protein